MIQEQLQEFNKKVVAINSIIAPRVYKFVIEYVVKHINIVSMIEYLFLNLVLNAEITIYILKKTEIKSISVFNSPSWVRTNDPSVNSRMLYH